MPDGLSILDRVQSAKQSEDRAHFNPVLVVSKLLQHLTSKEENVLRRRFGLNQKGNIETLEEIGDSFHVTRERIRQIENGAIKKLRELPEAERVLIHARHLISSILSERGGLMEERSLFDAVLTDENISDESERSLIFLLRHLLNDKVLPIEETVQLRAGWKSHTGSVIVTEQVIGEATRVFRSVGKALTQEAFLDAFRKTETYRTYESQLSDATIMAVVALSQDIRQNPYGEYGLVSWGSIVPHRMSDKIYLVLKKAGKPMHFTEIAETINTMDFDRRRAYPPTVHNELILNDEYVLVGRGIYALSEWGYKPGVVADVLARILRETGSPLTREELVARVLKERIVKRNTIHLALTNRKLFQKHVDGTYALAEKAA